MSDFTDDMTMADPSDWYVTCKFCGEENLYWDRSELTQGWRLFRDEGGVHECRKVFGRKK